MQDFDKLIAVNVQGLFVAAQEAVWPFRPISALGSWVLLIGAVALLAGCEPQQNASAPKPSVEHRQAMLAEQQFQQAKQTISVQNPALNNKLPVYELRMEPNELSGMERTVYATNRHSAKFIANGETYEGVTVRY